MNKKLLNNEIRSALVWSLPLDTTVGEAKVIMQKIETLIDNAIAEQEAKPRGGMMTCSHMEPRTFFGGVDWCPSCGAISQDGKREWIYPVGA